MDKLLAVIYELVMDQHPAKVKSLCVRIKSSSSESSPSLSDFFTTEAANLLLDKVLIEWKRVGCSGEEFAGLVAGASFGYLAEKNRENVELVWTGPDLKQFPVRRSEQVLLDVIKSSVDSLFIVSFVLVNIPSIEAAIKQAVDRGVDVRMLIESEDKDNSGNFLESVVRLYENIPGIMLYVWPREKRENMGGGFARVHAKCTVADKKVAFVTSANLTSAALDKNIEMGVQITGGNIPSDIYCQLTSMINSKEIIPYAVNKLSVAPNYKEAMSIAIDKLPGALLNADPVLVRFKNEKLDIEELRLFSSCNINGEKPKINSVVVINHSNKLLVGKYTWSRQQDMDSSTQFYLVSIRGFTSTQSFKIEDDDWADFYPVAVEVNQ